MAPTLSPGQLNAVPGRQVFWGSWNKLPRRKQRGINRSRSKIFDYCCGNSSIRGKPRGIKPQGNSIPAAPLQSNGIPFHDHFCHSKQAFFSTRINSADYICEYISTTEKRIGAHESTTAAASDESSFFDVGRSDTATRAAVARRNLQRRGLSVPREQIRLDPFALKAVSFPK